MVKAQLAGETHRPQHAHRVLAVPPLRVVADEAQPSGAQVIEAVGVVEDGKVADVVVKGVDREIAPEGVLLDGSVGVVAQDQSVFDPPVGLCHVRVEAAEGRHLDDLGAEVDMGQAEASPDQPAIAKDPAYFFGLGVGGDVEVLGLAPEQEVADPAAHQMGLKAGLAQAIQDLEGIGADVGARDVVFRTGYDPRSGWTLGRAGPGLPRSARPSLRAGGGVGMTLPSGVRRGRIYIGRRRPGGCGQARRGGLWGVLPEEALADRRDPLLEGW